MDMFTTRTMMAMVEAGKKTNNTWLRDRYFGYRPTFNTQKIEGWRRGSRTRGLLHELLRSTGTLSDARDDRRRHAQAPSG